MQISACPKCERPVTIPSGTDESATVSCPLCEQEFAISEMTALEDLPPMLVIVGAEVAPSEEPSNEGESAEIVSESDSSKSTSEESDSSD
jgi:hypothetical protein